MDHFELRHTMNLRMPLEVFQWIRSQSHAAGITPSTYAMKRLAELAQQDLQPAGARDDLLSSTTHD